MPVPITLAFVHLLYVSHYYPPEVNAPAVRVSELARAWVRAGHQVTVLTAFPSHPGGRLLPPYTGRRLCSVEDHEGVRVIRMWTFLAANAGVARRALSYLSFLLSAVAVGAWRCERPTVVIGTSPQFFAAVAAWLLAVLKRAPFVFEVRDLWPEEIRAVDAMRSDAILSGLERLEEHLYDKAELIVAVARGTIDTLLRRGVAGQKLALVPNGVDLGTWNVPDRQDCRGRLGIEAPFVVSYIGTHGMAHGLEVVLGAAAELTDVHGLEILMVGDGADRESLSRRAREAGLSNVRFLGQVDRETVRLYYGASDICLVPLRKIDLFTRNVPSKVYEIMASARPIVIGTEGESRRLVEEAGCGLGVTPECPRALATAIRTLLAQPETRARMGLRGRAYVAAHHDRPQLAFRYLDLVAHVAEGSSLSSDVGAPHAVV